MKRKTISLILASCILLAGCSSNAKVTEESTETTETSETTTEATTTTTVEETTETTEETNYLYSGEIKTPDNYINPAKWQEMLANNYEAVDVDNELIYSGLVLNDLFDGQAYVAIHSKECFSPDDIYPGAVVSDHYGNEYTVGEKFEIDVSGYETRHIVGYGLDDFYPEGDNLTEEDIAYCSWFQYDETKDVYSICTYDFDDDVGYSESTLNEYYSVLPVAKDLEIYFFGYPLCHYDGETDKMVLDSDNIPEGYGAVLPGDESCNLKFVPADDKTATIEQFCDFISKIDEFEYLDFDYDIEYDLFGDEFDPGSNVYTRAIHCYIYVEDGTITKVFFNYLLAGVEHWGQAESYLGSVGNGTYLYDPQ